MGDPTEKNSMDSLLAEQRREITEAKTLDSDLDMAFDRQMQEAINASLSLHPCISLCQPKNDNHIVVEGHDFDNMGLLLEDIKRLEQERWDREATEVIGRWPPKQCKIAMLVDQVSLLQRKFTYCNPILVAHNDIKYAFKLARDAIVSQVTMPAESSHGKKTVNETCVICLEDTDIEHIFSVDGCQHRYYFSCMKQHVEVKLLYGMVPKCPHEGCKSELNIDTWKKFLTAKLIETMSQRIKEASIPVSEKIYCPYPKCSALMSKTEVSEYAKEIFVEHSSARKCMNCHGVFCLDCNVPWHSNMTCHIYKRMNPNPLLKM